MKKSNSISLVMIRDKNYERILPFSLLFLSYSLKKEGFRVHIIHITNDQINVKVEEIIKANPVFVGFSVLTGSPTFYAAQMSKKIREKNPRIPIIWGGVHPSIIPRQCLQEDYIDIVVIGEGERTIVELAKGINNKDALKNILGIGFKDNKKIILTPPRPFSKNIDEYRMDMDIDFSEYIQRRTVKFDDKKIEIHSLGYYSSRGCPHNCAFCYNTSFRKNSWRAHKKEIVIKDIKWLIKNHNINEIKFLDDNFWVDKTRAIDIIKEINIYSASEIRIDYIDAKLAKQLKDLKITWFLIGAESGNNQILTRMNKCITTELMLNRIKIMARHHNLSVQYAFILGIPGETRKEMNDTVNFILKIKKIHTNANFTIGPYLPYPGTELFKSAVNKGYKPPEKTEDWKELDKFTTTVKLPWIDTQMCLNIRHLCIMLNWRFPFNWWSKLRLKTKYFNFNWDIRLFVFLYVIQKKYRSKIWI